MEIEILPFKIQGAQSKMKFSPFKIQGAPWKKKLDQNMLKNIIVLTFLL